MGRRVGRKENRWMVARNKNIAAGVRAPSHDASKNGERIRPDRPLSELNYEAARYRLALECSLNKNTSRIAVKPSEPAWPGANALCRIPILRRGHPSVQKLGYGGD